MKVALFVAVSLALVACVLASSHSEAPGTASNPGADVSDFYMFRSYESGRENYVTFIVNVKPLQDTFAGPNYHSLQDDKFYEIYIDNNGDAQEDITFQFFYGNRMGGDLINVPFIPDEDDCNSLTAQRSSFGKRNWNPDVTKITVSKHGGIEINVGGQNVAIPLKAVFPVTCTGNTCDSSSLNWFEWFRLNIVTGDRTLGTVTPVSSSSGLQFDKPFDNAGEKLFPNYDTYASQFYHTFTMPGCTGGNGRMFLGQRTEPFFINLGQIFDALNLIPIPGFPGAVTEDNNANNALKNKAVTSFVVEVPISCVTGNGGGVIGAWTGVRQLHHDADDHVPGKQLSRLGNPLINELVIGLRDKNVFNAAHPRDDGQFLKYVQYPTLPEIISIVYKDAVNCQLGATLATLAPSNYPRNDLVTTFLTGISGINQPANVVPCEVLRLNTSIPITPYGSQKNMGVIGGDNAGFPNGRRPGDDVVDIALRVMVGKLCKLGLGCTADQAPIGDVELTDGAPVRDTDFLPGFPYLKPPPPGGRNANPGFVCTPGTK